jgi:penicillin amidase
MRIQRVLPLIFAIAIIWALNHAFSVSVPAFGKIIDPVNGIMANAEPVNEDFNKNVSLKGLRSPVSVWIDTSLIPHVRAGNDHDLYYTQGYIHAYFRLWQMDMETRAAGGRVSEVAGAKAIEFDRGMRREGMVWGAQHSLEAMEREPRTKAMLDAYRDGINAYVHSLNYRRLPLEYKLMEFAPEDWTNLRTALLLKYMARDLTGKTDDIAYTVLRDQLGQREFDFLFPDRIKGSRPVIPEGTKFDAPSLQQPKEPGDSVWAHLGQSSVGNRQAAVQSEFRNPHSEIAEGSNSWAISGAHTASGKPILCNDPHLGLNLPSLWFEMQLTAPGINVYGASLPGAPGIVIGFNEKISWGFTNNYRDVKDFYEITPAGKDAYLFCGKAKPFQKNIEVIRVRGAKDVTDTVLYTIHGPVTYDPTFFDETKSGKLLACTWMAHRGTNELLATYLLNRAGDYAAFTDAISHFECPAQNISYADVSGSIAMWGQGRFINKWKGQGKYVMRGDDSSTLWGKDIPMAENPHVLNPPQGYVVSANQQVTDSTYPYWYNQTYLEWRSWEINSHFEKGSFTAYGGFSGEFGTNNVEISMQRLQNENYSKLLEKTAALQPINTADLSPDSPAATSYQVWWYQLYKDIWQDEFPAITTKWPTSERTVELLLSDSASRYYDDKKTPQVETLRDIVQRAFRETTDSLEKLRRTTGLEWYKVKNTTLTHLAKIPAFSYDHLQIGGWSNTINACTHDHGPSWRMIVEMDSIPRAYTIYPGGQSGNPGSPYYSDFIRQWVEGKYHAAQFITASTTKNPLTYTWTLTP